MARNRKRLPSLHSIFLLLALVVSSVAETNVTIPVTRGYDTERRVDRSDRSDNSQNRTHTPRDGLQRIEKYIAKELRDELDFSTEGLETVEEHRHGAFNNSLTKSEAILETVARVDKHHTHHHHAHNATKEQPTVQNVTAEETKKKPEVMEEEEDEGEVQRLIDAEDNEYVMTKPHKGMGQMELVEDFTLISDLVKVIVAAAIGGLVFGLLSQPIILGYLVAGSIIGPGGLGLIDELVQVETLAQFGVVFLIFVLGVEFNGAKVNKVKQVAVFGGALMISLCMVLGTTVSFALNVPARQGLFVGALVSMSSTAVVIKCLMDTGTLHSVPGQVMIGTLIFQDCALGLFLAVLPNLAVDGYSYSGLFLKLGGELVLLAMFVGAARVFSRVIITPLLNLLLRLSIQTGGEELFLLGVIAICLSTALISESLGLSVEVGAFIAGLMLSGPNYSERTLNQVEPVRNFFASLFLASVGMLMHPMFLWHHLDVLLACLVLLFLIKTMLQAIIVRAFGYHNHSALMVGIALAQIGEFSFVLLSRAKTLGLIPRTLYLILLGTATLSLCFTPFAFRWACTMVPMAPAGGEDLGQALCSPVAEIMSSPPPSKAPIDGGDHSTSVLRQRDHTLTTRLHNF